METVNYWILAPLLIFLCLITVPIAYIWISVYGPKLRRISSEKSNLSGDKPIDAESASTEVPEMVNLR